ncbi:hypothetical protein B9Z55_021593 [Caenorhabditis nigoni]|uniref:F-box domain-containing protein n=1 Tax=Caenorhabditis nigoni TaxID=1611254 RepID=A0A2G5TSM7_9PELO|nr:hypothetical protein B9Z55_021593 [Caenorhabditis nigoni]
MPIRIFSIPAADFQYALHCMDIGDLIAFSLCSNRTKNLVKSSSRKIDPISAQIDENTILLKIEPNLQFLLREDSFSIELHRGNGIEIWRKPGFTQRDFIAHFLSISRSSIIPELRMIELFQWEPMKSEDVLKGIKFQIMDHKRRLTRADGEELLVTVGPGVVVFEFLSPQDLSIQ